MVDDVLELVDWFVPDVADCLDVFDDVEEPFFVEFVFPADGKAAVGSVDFWAADVPV